MRRFLGLFAILLTSCGSAEDPSGTQATAPPQVEPRPEGAFRLVINAKLEEGAEAPAGYRILRLPPRIGDFPPGAQVDRREVQKGSWRPYPGPDQPLIVDLFPTPDVLEDRWMVAAYATNELHGFRYADNGFRRIELGTSETFQLAEEGGELQLDLEIGAPLQLQPEFRDPEEIHGPFGFEFSYGPIAAAPRRIRGTWSGASPLPLLISRYAIGREGYLSLFQTAWPSETELGPVEFELQDGTTRVPMPQPIPSGPLTLEVRAGDQPGWAEAEVLGGFRGDRGEWEVVAAGRTAADGKLTIERAQAGRYHLSARHAEDGRVLLGWVATDGSPFEGRIATPPKPETGTLALLELPASEDWQVEIWSFWGALLVGRSQGKPGEAVTLPHAGEMRHQALATRFDAASGVTHAHLYLECEWHQGEWQFHAAPTELEIENFTDELGLVLRLQRTEDPEPEQSFPPRRWQTEPGSGEMLDYFPVSFRGGLALNGLPEGQYEAGIWGLERSSGRMAELATFWPIAEARLEDE